MVKLNRVQQLALEYPDRWGRDADGNIICAYCGSHNLKANGSQSVGGQKIPRIKCKDCGKSQTGQALGRPREDEVGDSALRMRRHRAKNKSQE